MALKQLRSSGSGLRGTMEAGIVQAGVAENNDIKGGIWRRGVGGKAMEAGCRTRRGGDEMVEAEQGRRDSGSGVMEAE